MFRGSFLPRFLETSLRGVFGPKEPLEYKLPSKSKASFLS